MIKKQKSMILLSIFLLVSLSLFGCSSLTDNRMVYTGKSKHWEARYEIIETPQLSEDDGRFQLYFLGEKFSKGEFEFTISHSSTNKKLSIELDGKDDKKKSPVYKGRMDFDLEKLPDSTLIAVIKWDGFEEKIELKPTDK